MYVEVLGEYGLDHALLGMSLSYYDHKEPIKVWWDDAKRAKAFKRASILAHKDGGHNKFLEHITVYLYIQASRDFWSEYDTYRVGMSKQSSSTMHTLDKRSVDKDDFEEGTSELSIDAFNHALELYKNPESGILYKNITILKKNLPEGWLQEREIVTNYKTLKNLVAQRKGHRLKQWDECLSVLSTSLQYPEWVGLEKLPERVSMISQEEYQAAVKQQEEAQKIINQYFKEKAEAFEVRLKSDEPFKDEELYYSRNTLCPCGHGLAYPKDCTPQHYWDCSAILKGEADMAAIHTGKLYFAHYSIKGESEGETTRGVFKPPLQS